MRTPHVTITVSAQSPLEQQAQARLQALLQDPRLRQYTQMPTVHLDASSERSSSFPMPVLGRDQLVLEGDALLAAFLHGQAHWALNRLPGGPAAVEEAKGRWLEANDAGMTPPPPDALSQPCASGDYLLHVAVCTLQFHALAELLGKERAGAVMSGLPGYDWFRDQMVDSADALDGFITRHDLTFPTPPSGAIVQGNQVQIQDGPTATLASGDPTESELVERLTDLHQRFDLRSWMFSREVELDASRPPSSDGPVPRISPFFLRFSDHELLLNYLQLQACWQAGQLDASRVQAALAQALSAEEGEPWSAVPVSIVLGCAAALHGLRELIGTEAAEEAAREHPRNGALYAKLTPLLGDIRQAVADAGMNPTLAED